MPPDRIRRGVWVSFTTNIEEVSVSLPSLVQVAGHDQVEPSVPVALHVQGFEERQHHWAIRGGIQRRMKAPVPASPRLHL